MDNKNLNQRSASRPRAGSNLNRWTLALAAAGVLSPQTVSVAEEAQHQVLTALSSTTLSGYVDTSAIWKLGSDKRGGQTLPGRTFDGPDKQDGFNLESVKLSLEKPLDEGVWSAGYKTDLIFGPNANYYTTVLNGGSLDANDFALKQGYVALRAPVGNGLDLKMGVFDTIVGYEVFETANNPNFSRSYGYALEPTHHTGVLATYQVADWLSIAGGIANTHSSAINARPVRGTELAAESAKTYMGAVTITLPEGAGALAGSTIYAGIVDGLNGLGAGTTDQDITHYYAGGTLNTPVTGLTVGVAYDYRDDGPSVTGAGLSSDNRTYAVAGYLMYAFTDKLKGAARVDYVNADNGTLYGEPGSGAVYEVSHTSSHEKLLGNTFTLEYSLWDNVITRGEVRWDHSLTGDRPFGNANEKNAVSLAANIVYKF